MRRSPARKGAGRSCLSLCIPLRKDSENFARSGVPALERRLRFAGLDGSGNELGEEIPVQARGRGRVVCLADGPDNGLKVGRGGVARAAHVELLLDDERGGQFNVALGVADADHAPAEVHPLDGEPVGGGCADGLDDDAGGGEATPFFRGIVGEGGPQLSRQGEFLRVQVGGDHGGAAPDRTDHGAQAHHTAADHQHGVGIHDAAAGDGVEAHAHRFDEGGVAQVDPVGGDDLLPGEGDVFAHRAVALHTQRLVVLAGVVAARAAGGAAAAIRIRVHGDDLSGPETLRYAGAGGGDDGADLVPGDDVRLRHRVAPAEGVEVAAAEADVVQPEQDFAGSGDGLRQVDHADLPRLGNL